MLSTVDDFTNKFECSDDMKRLVKEKVFSARAAKVLFIESMLLKQFEIMGESPLRVGFEGHEEPCDEAANVSGKQCLWNYRAGSSQRALVRCNSERCQDQLTRSDFGDNDP